MARGWTLLGLGLLGCWLSSQWGLAAVVLSQPLLLLPALLGSLRSFRWLPGLAVFPTAQLCKTERT